MGRYSCYVEAKDLLRIKGVKISAHLNVSQEIATAEYLSDDPDLEFAQSCLTPVAMITLPGYEVQVPFTTFESFICFDLYDGSTFGKFLQGFLKIHNLTFKLREGR